MAVKTPQAIAAELHELAKTAKEPVDDILTLPRKLTDANLDETFKVLGTHHLLSIGALGGMVGLFGYAKAVRELTDLGMNADALIAATDTGDFAVRLAVPFLLLAIMLAGLQLTWWLLLAKDHRRLWSYLGWTFLGTALVAVPYFGVWAWAPQAQDPFDFPPRIDRASDATEFFFWSIISLIAVPLIALLTAGFLKGVRIDNRVQGAVHWGLSRIASPLGLFVALAVLGLVLLWTPRLSVLVPQRHYWELSEAAKREIAGNESRNPEEEPRVLETSESSTPLLIKPSISRIGGMLLVSRYVDTAAEKESPRALYIIPTSKVSCIRKRLKDETTLVRTCVSSPPPLPQPVVLRPDSIANFATTVLGCSPATSSANEIAAVALFATAEPREEPSSGWPTDTWRVFDTALSMPGLTGLAPEEDPLVARLWDDAALVAIAERAARRPGGRIWVLGFASAPDDASANFTLSERRALELKRLLTEKNPSLERRVYARPMGETSLADLFGVDNSQRDQIAVAFYCG